MKDFTLGQQKGILSGEEFKFLAEVKTRQTSQTHFSGNMPDTGEMEDSIDIYYYSITVRITGDKPNAHLKWNNVSKDKDYHIMICTSEEIANKVKDMLHDLTSIEVKIIKKTVEEWEDILEEEIEEMKKRGIQFRRDLDMLYPIVGDPHLFGIKYDNLIFRQ